MRAVRAGGGGVVAARVLGANDSWCRIFPGKGPVAVSVDFGVGAPGVSARGPGGDVCFFGVYFIVSGFRDETHGFECCLDGWMEVGLLLASRTDLLAVVLGGDTLLSFSF